MRKSISVLLVDDDHIFSDMIKEYLSLNGYYVETAENGSRAYELVRIKSFDVVLLDINMPKMGGLETIKAIKERRPELITIIISGDEDYDSIRSAIGYGASDFLQKPFDVEDLLESLNSLCLTSRGAKAVIA